MIHFINENGGNKELKNRKFPLAKGIRKHLQRTLDNYNGDKTIKGYKRLINILGMDGILYNEMKRIKNFFDNYSGTDKSDEFILNGGEPMKTWVNNTLYTATKAIHDFKQAKKDAGYSNAFIKSHEKNKLHPHITNETVSKPVQKVILISEKQTRLLKEAIDNVSNLNTFLSELSNLSSFKKKYEFCKQKLGQPQGRGSSRVVFQIDDNKILKLAFNQKGIAQNSEESSSYATECDITPKIYNVGDNNEYIVCEFVLPAKKQDFIHCMNIKWEDFCKFINTCAAERGDDQKWNPIGVYSWDELYDMMENNETLYGFHEYIVNTYTPVGDMQRIVNYGMTIRDSEPTIVLLDYGLSDDVYNNFYKRR